MNKMNKTKAVRAQDTPEYRSAKPSNLYTLLKPGGELRGTGVGMTFKGEVEEREREERRMLEERRGRGRR